MSKDRLGVSGTWSDGLQILASWNCVRDVRFVVHSDPITVIHDMGYKAYAERLRVCAVFHCVAEERYPGGLSGIKHDSQDRWNPEVRRREQSTPEINLKRLYPRFDWTWIFFAGNEGEVVTELTLVQTSVRFSAA